MTINKILILALALVPIHAFANLEVFADLKGNARTKLSGIVHHRHSGDCYVMGKGDDYEDYGASDVTFSGSQNATSSSRLTWGSHAFKNRDLLVRMTNLDVSLTTDNTAEIVSLNLADVFPGALGQINKTKCTNTDAFGVTNNATLTGTITIRYKVPADVWAITIGREEAQGFLALNNLLPVKSLLGKNLDEGLWDGAILWVEPGQVVEQRIHIPLSEPGQAQLGKIRLTFKPVASVISAKDFTAFLTDLTNMTNGPYRNINNSTIANAFIRNAMGVVRLGNQISLMSKLVPLQVIKQASDRLFEIANSVVTTRTPVLDGLKADGLSIKAAAAFASYQLARGILQDISVYCSDVSVKMPLTGQEQTVLGLQAAGFWLSRSYQGLQTYSYEPVAVVLNYLSDLQNSGMTPAMIAKDEKLRQKIQRAVTEMYGSMNFASGPFDRAYVDFNKMIQIFPVLAQQGAGGILTQLRNSRQKQSDFVISLAKALQGLKPNSNEHIDYGPLFAQISDLKTEQIAIAAKMKSSVRLLSLEHTEDSGQIINQIIDIMNNQLNIFSRPVDIEGFSSLSKAFEDTGFAPLTQPANQCLSLGISK